jgi:signal transduction histidine kinase
MTTSSIPLPTPSASQRTRARLAPLRAPLVVKVVGAYLAVLTLITAFIAAGPGDGWAVGQLVGAAAVATVTYVALILIALRPVHDLEGVATRVWSGDLGVRFGSSDLADRGVLRLGAMFNLLLDGVADDRRRMRALAGEIVRTGDRERSAIARELHDSTAQQLAGVQLTLAAVARDIADPVVRAQLAELRDSVHGVLEEIRTLAHTVHPRVLDDLGLSAALRHLAREIGRTAPIDIEVQVPDSIPLDAGSASTIYRVVQEALRNTVRHSRAASVEVALSVRDGFAQLMVRDNGVGFDVDFARRRHSGMGIFTMQERIELFDGEFSIVSAPGQGTTIWAVIPLTRSGSTPVSTTPNQVPCPLI